MSKKELFFTCKYGDFLDYEQREATKDECYNILYDNKCSLNERTQAGRLLLFCYFCRSYEAYSKNFNLHPNLRDYISMILSSADFWKERLHTDVYEALVKEYGTKEGIEAGSSYYLK